MATIAQMSCLGALRAHADALSRRQVGMGDPERSRIWDWAELCRVLGLPAREGPDVFGIEFDSRRIGKGDLFVALPISTPPRFKSLPPASRDGHEFLIAAVRAGAVGVLAERPSDHDVRALVVPSSWEGIWSLAEARRDELQGHAVALTGSAGKTTLKQYLMQALPAFARPGNYNNHLGVPLCMANTPPDVQIAVYEIGTNSPGEIRDLSRLVRPDVAVLINVSLAHIGNFPNLEELTREKLSIAEGLGPNGLFVVPTRLASAGSTRCLTFGRDVCCDVRLRSEAGGQAEIESGQESISVPVPGGGTHRAETLTAAAAVLVALGKPLSNLLNIRDPVPTGRGNTVHIGSVELIDDSYNANPASMQGALAQLAQRSACRRVAILGDMRELGVQGAELHLQLLPLMEQMDQVVVVGELMRKPYGMLPASARAGSYDSADRQCLEGCLETLQPGDCVLVKGSNTIFWTLGFVQSLTDMLRGIDKQA